MPVPDNYVALVGSERSPARGAVAVGRADPDERIQITVHIRKNTSANGEAIPAAGRHLSHEEFGRIHSAADSDIEKVRQFAAAHKLEVIDVNKLHRAIKLSGNVSGFANAFAVELQQFEYPGGRYRGRVG